MVINLHNICKKYRSKTALSNINLDLSCGVHALLGSNGAGKSTMMNILVDLLKPTEGEVLLDGANIHKMGRDYRKIIGYLPQNPGFYNNFSGMELMKYYAALKKVKNSQSVIDELLEFVNLTDEKTENTANIREE